MNSKQINSSRRRFLTSALSTAALYSAGGLPALTRNANAMGFSAVARPILAHMFLNGGPDMRHMLPPAFSSAAGSVGRGYWESRTGAHGIGNNLGSAERRWNEDFFAVSDGGTEFGILRRCAWLKDMWDAGNVAIICNVFGADSRDHEHAIRTMELGNMAAEKPTDGNGWGGRLAAAAGGNVVALTTSARRFCFGPNPSQPRNLSLVDKSNLVPAADTRNAGLFDVAPDAFYGRRERLTRSVKTYYAAKRAEIGPDSVYFQFMELERKVREFGVLLEDHLAAVPVPAPLQALLDAEDFDHNLARQMLNMYDSLAANDVLDMRVASLEYNGWDTHDNQRGEFEPKIEALFGRNQAMETLFNELPDSARANTAFVFAGEFGRQLKDNGGNGTDHGVGNAVILVGESVRGGVYGDMFPEAELARLDEPSPDITGLTGIDHAFGAMCEWVQSGSKGVVFPNSADAPLESGLNLGTLFS